MPTCPDGHDVPEGMATCPHCGQSLTESGGDSSPQTQQRPLSSSSGPDYDVERTAARLRIKDLMIGGVILVLLGGVLAAATYPLPVSNFEGIVMMRGSIAGFFVSIGLVWVGSVLVMYSVVARAVLSALKAAEPR